MPFVFVNGVARRVPSVAEYAPLSEANGEGRTIPQVTHSDFIFFACVREPSSRIDRAGLGPAPTVGLSAMVGWNQSEHPQDAPTSVIIYGVARKIPPPLRLLTA